MSPIQDCTGRSVRVRPGASNLQINTARLTLFLGSSINKHLTPIIPLFMAFPSFHRGWTQLLSLSVLRCMFEDPPCCRVLTVARNSVCFVFVYICTV